ncbi:hypothetical protein BIY24_05415 [Halobacteriovorax marinus]|nr:hypothetical protein BIY24_05415 [Halobacteriovorax marinus]
MTELTSSSTNQHIEDEHIIGIANQVASQATFIEMAKRDKRRFLYSFQGIKFSIKFNTLGDIKQESEEGRPAYLPGVSPSINWLSDFNDFTHFNKWMDQLFGVYSELVKSFKITRLDIPLNIDIPYKELRNRVQRPKTRIWREFISKKSTLYLGKNHRELTIYEKDFERDELEFKRKKKEQPNEK